MKPLSEVVPGLMVIQVQIHAVCPGSSQGALKKPSRSPQEALRKPSRTTQEARKGHLFLKNTYLRKFGLRCYRS